MGADCVMGCAAVGGGGSAGVVPRKVPVGPGPSPVPFPPMLGGASGAKTLDTACAGFALALRAKWKIGRAAGTTDSRLVAAGFRVDATSIGSGAGAGLIAMLCQ